MLLARRTCDSAVVYAMLLSGMVFVFTAGCEKPPTTVTGSITLDGQPLAVEHDARGTVVFQANGGSGTVATGLIDATGNFELATGSSHEVAPGDYCVTVSVAQLVSNPDQVEQGSRLVTPTKYASARTSGLTAHVSDGENHLKFDLSSVAENTASTSTAAPSEGPASNTPEASTDSIEKK